MKFNKLIPELCVFDIKESLRFYKSLGFKVEYERQGTKFAFVSYEGSQLMLQERGGKWEAAKLERPLGRGVNFQIIVRDVKPLLARMEKSGIAVKFALEENWYEKGGGKIGVKEFLAEDPDGYLLRFQQKIGSRKQG